MYVRENKFFGTITLVNMHYAFFFLSPGWEIIVRRECDVQ